VYFGWEEGSMKGTKVKAFKSCKCASFFLVFLNFFLFYSSFIVLFVWLIVTKRNT